MIESLPSGCTADKTTASKTLANGVEVLTFYVDCEAETGAVITGLLSFTRKKPACTAFC